MNDGINLFGYIDDEAYQLNINEIERVCVEDNKTIAYVFNKIYRLKYRLYQIEEMLGEAFIKINQSSLINKRFIKCFSNSFGGTISVILKSGTEDYVSRRQTKNILERMGIKK